MTLAPAARLIADARTAGTGIGAFNVVHLETAEALVAASESSGLPVILQISQNCADYHGALAPIGLATLALARAAGTPVAVHLDHAERPELVDEAIELGFGSVMFDGGALPYDENVRLTARVAERAHAAGVYVEGELGEVGGKDGAHAPGVRTDPAEALAFVRDTGVDALAVAVGSSHAMQQRTAALDLGRIAELRATLDVPLVLHGSSGVPDESLDAAVRAGMTKINVSTHLNGFFTRAVREALAAQPDAVDSRKYVRAGRAAIVPEAARLLQLFALRDA
ncbi:fructose-bisphosphate aldolase [Leucobacter sp. OLJS4]|uniref:class II fructose-bisphosphate aldolase n=1 Tax=unclassified Leucobacter TaxID=2621730 RepID=UPI000C18DE57|nr:MULTISPECIES: class II fructose-bisphosphate aldolase [unclassified Leucobacter]PII84151.1 fructose-bisphosphate aldolase [Leucobacter sp. OLCALW19]PII92233.1 fructose-bisphosphate aldolase [Leucobacter sp. OLAS13]PII95293.1 fructose-bisphosphate aldolase [Leucobacter sp. OLTLW20]PII99785.1 fructose-bisphosphate aldolase [Leucobacter sp. OLDS2]PII99915.1 fructose-bisphosphate aldolase [Leucobacter sp. OLCS4]